MTLRRSTERLIENYVLSDLSAADVEEVERVLARDDQDAQAMREVLDIERAIRDAMEVPEFSGSVVDDVLHRVSRRTQSQLNHKLPPDLAATTVEGALADGRVTRRIIEGRQRQSRLVVWLRAAVIVALIGGGYTFIIRGLFVEGDQNKPNVIAKGSARKLQTMRLGRVRYASIDRVVDREPILTKARPNDFSSVFSDQVIETSGREGAEVDLTQGSRLVVLPNTRLVIVRGPVHASYLVRLLQGGVRVDTRGRRPLHVASADAYSGLIEGRGEVQLIEDTPLQSSFNSHPSMLVRVKTRGGRFQNGSTQLHLQAGDLALLNRNRAVRLSADDKGPDLTPQLALAALPLGLARPDAPAIRLGDRTLARSEVAADLMRSFGASVVDIITRSIVIDRALDAQGINLSSGRRDDAMEMVGREERFFSQPLRSRRATEERAFHLAGLFALENFRSGGSLTFDTQTALSTYTVGWNRLASQLRIKWHQPSDETAMTIIFSGAAIPVGRDEIWSSLKGFLRAFELDRLVQSIIERESVRIWLDARGETMPGLKKFGPDDPRLAAAMRSMMVREGRTEASVASLSVVRAAVMPSIRQPSELEIDQYLETASSSAVQVAFEHIAFPFVDPDNGRVSMTGIVGDKAAALELARQAAVKWRVDGAPQRGSAERISSYLWPDVPATRVGPRAWWSEIYGSAFTEQLLALGEDEVSQPLEGPEAWHVVRARHRRPLTLDVRQARRIAQRVIVHRRFQRRLAGILSSQEVQRLDVSSILND